MRRGAAGVLFGVLWCVGNSAAAQSVSGGAARLRAWQQNREMAASSPFADLEWQVLGPKFAGGRIESIDAPADRPGTIYVGVGAGGIWKTENGGLTWRAIFQRQSTHAIGDLTVSRSDPELIWVGTGEAHLSGTSYPGTGLFRSVDGGASWQSMGLVDSEHIGKVAIDPRDDDLLLVAAMGPKHSPGGERGIYKSSDGGQSFRRVLFVGEQVALVDLVQDPGDPDRLFAAAWDRGERTHSGLYRSTDHGETWERLGGGLLDRNVGRVAVDLSASSPGVVYALMVDHSPPGGGRKGVRSVLFRSDDGGDHWTQTHEEEIPTYIGWDFCDVRVAPDDADQVYLCGLRLLVSTDGGRSFERGGETVLRLHPHRGTGMHLDMHDIWIDPDHPERVLLGTDGGLYQSWDRARTWLHLNNLPIAEFYRVHLDEDEPFRIWGGTQDNASFVGPSSERYTQGVDEAWQQVFLDPWAGGDGFSTFPDPFDREIVYYAQQQGDLKRTRRGRLRRARRIQPRAANTAMDEEDATELRWAWDTPFHASIHSEGRLYCAAQRVLRSEDRGDSWTAISPDLGERGLLALAESALDPRRLVVGGGRGRVHFTIDGGASWTAAAERLPEASVRDLVTSAHDPDQVYVALSGAARGDRSAYVFRTGDDGASWRSLAPGLPAEPVNAIAEDPLHPEILFVGTDLGVYVSIDAGASWSSLCSTLPTAPVVDLAVQGRAGALVAVTHGLSAFLLEIGPIRNALGK